MKDAARAQLAKLHKLEDNTNSSLVSPPSNGEQDVRAASVNKKSIRNAHRRSQGASEDVEHLIPLKGWLIVIGLIILSCYLAGKAMAAPAMSSHIPKGYWLTDDKGAVLAFSPCEHNEQKLCGVIRALPGARVDPLVAQHADELCGLPLIWDLEYNGERKRWENGSIIELETEEIFSVRVWTESKVLKVHAYKGVEVFGETFEWMPTAASSVGCR